MTTIRLAGFIAIGIAVAAGPSGVWADNTGTAHTHKVEEPFNLDAEEAAAKERFDTGYAWVKQNDPNQYARELARFERGWKIRRIANEFLMGRLPRASAREALRPLVAESVTEQAGQVDAQISRLKQQIADLERLQDKPEAAQEAEILRLLGPEQPPATAPIAAQAELSTEASGACQGGCRSP